jgi:two-component system sensor histidine kinase BaeS
LLLFDASGEQIAGPPPPLADGPKMTARVISLNGQTIGTAKIIPHAPTPGGVDARFLRSQYINAALLVVALMIFAALAAWGFARAGTRRLANMEAATKEIAHGNFAVRTDAVGADEISTMGQNINQMAESLARADQARRGWLAEIGHELRTPLTVLSGELEALKDGIRPLDQNAISSLQEETGRLGDLIEDLHFMAVSDLTDAPHKFTPDDAVKLVGDVTERFRPLLTKAGLKLDVELGSKAPLAVVWDGKRIEQLLGNLLTNALRYTDAPGTVQVRLESERDRIIISVEDSAPGVPVDALPRLFEPLFRVDEARDRSSGGSGLGLAVCRTIVEAHGGRISAKDSNLGGLLIELNLPQETSRA